VLFAGLAAVAAAAAAATLPATSANTKVVLTIAIFFIFKLLSLNFTKRIF
jgi:hypothetical protein